MPLNCGGFARHRRAVVTTTSVSPFPKAGSTFAEPVPKHRRLSHEPVLYSIVIDDPRHEASRRAWTGHRPSTTLTVPNRVTRSAKYSHERSHALLNTIGNSTWNPKDIFGVRSASN